MFPLKVVKTLALGALASNDLIGSLLSTVANEALYLISADLTWATEEHAGDIGPISVGVAHSDYSDAEVEQWIESVGSWDRADQVAREQSRRKCRQAGTFAGELSNEILNDGKSIRTKLGWICQEDETLRIWGFNQNDAALVAGTLVKVIGTIWARRA